MCGENNAMREESEQQKQQIRSLEKENQEWMESLHSLKN